MWAWSFKNCETTFQRATVQVSLAPWPIRSSGNTADDSAEILFHSFLQEAFVSSSCMGRDVRSLMLSIQHFLCWQRRRPPLKCPEGWFWKGLLWCVTCPNHASFHLITVARRDACGPTRKLILPRPVVGLVLHVVNAEKFPQELDFKSLDPFLRVSR